MKKLLFLILVPWMTSAASALNLTITADPVAPNVYVSGGLDRDLYIVLLGDGVGDDSLVTTLHVPPSPCLSGRVGNEQDMIDGGLGFLVPAGFTGDFYVLASLLDEPYVDGVYITGSGTAGDHAYACWFDEDGGYGVIGTVKLVSSRYVDADATFGANNGMSWADAFVHLQDALDAARSTPSISRIYVAEGIYRPDQGSSVTSGDRTATFGLINGITIAGGYAGYGEADPNVRDIEAYPSILSGDLGGNDSDIDEPADLLTNPTRAENSNHVLTASGVDETAVLDGFTITGGNADGYASILDKRGGALFNYNNAGPTIKNSKFVHNTAEIYGGAVYNYNDSNSNPTLINCSFTENATYEGGAMMNHATCTPTLLGCIFEDNLATGAGGAIRNLGDTILSNCVFIDNRAPEGGAIYNEKSSHTLTNCIFSGNSAGRSGGAIVNNDNCNLALTNCMFNANTASGGGPAYGGGAIWSDYVCTSTVTNCTFGGNSAVSYGGAIYDSMGIVTLSNSILWGNTATYGQQIALQIGPIVSISYCDIPNTPDAIFEEQAGRVQWGSGNIHNDPLFIDPGNNNLGLYDGSPCIDAGDNTAVPQDTFDLDKDGDTAERIPLDIDGEPRFSNDPATPNTGVPDLPNYPNIVDIGADEHSPCGSTNRPYPPGDVNHDCKVDFLDISIIGENWLKRS